MPGSLLKSAYGFEPVAGRLGTVSSTSAGAAASSFTYAYDPARAGLISTLTGPAHTVTNTWEGEREVLDVKTNTLLTAGVVSAYDYGVNSIGQRSTIDNSYEEIHSFASIPSIFCYTLSVFR